MSKKIILFGLIIIISLVFLLPSLVLAQMTGENDPGSGSDLPNPLGDKNVDPRVIIGNIIRAILGIVGSLALAVFIFGGFTWITSAGNEEKVKKGKDMIVWASLGLVIIFFSYALVRFVIGAVTGG